MIDHAQFAEDLALYALNPFSLNDPTRVALESHLADCNSCKIELEKLRATLGLLALSVQTSAPSLAARERLMSAISQSPGPREATQQYAQNVKPSFGRPWWALAPVFGTIILALFAVLLWRDNGRMRLRIETLNTELQQAERSQGRTSQGNAREASAASQAEMTLRLLTSHDAQRVELVAMGAKPRPYGKAIYNPRDGRLLFVAGNLSSLPPQRVYELWLLPQSGSRPLPAGVFLPDSHGDAAAMMPPVAGGVSAKGFAVTEEPAGGSPQPTSPIMMAGE